MTDCQHKPEHFCLETRVEGGWGSNDQPNAVITRLFFGTQKLCHCDACVERRGEEDIARLKARGLIA